MPASAPGARVHSPARECRVGIVRRNTSPARDGTSFVTASRNTAGLSCQRRRPDVCPRLADVGVPTYHSRTWPSSHTTSVATTILISHASVQGVVSSTNSRSLFDKNTHAPLGLHPGFRRFSRLFSGTSGKTGEGTSHDAGVLPRKLPRSRPTHPGYLRILGLTWVTLWVRKCD